MSILNKPVGVGAALASAVLALSSPQSAAAQSQEEVAEDVKDVAMTPLEDVGLSKEEIAEILLAALENPYAPAGNGRCNALIAEIAKLDTVLGEDFDIRETEKDGIDVDEKKVGKSLVGSIIPFRSVVREISGAAGNKRKAEAAITAGMTRRGYLKGLGQGKGCKYPARPKPD